ncbi:MAG: xylulokinase [Acholeplasmataceae bacterium]|nr:xylulokinase [Acholeplasmataceae bacterium]
MFIGIDLGTSSVKIVLVDKTGLIVNTVSNSYDLFIPKPSWTEQDPNDWYMQTIKGLKEIVEGYEDEIEGISFSGQMHGLVILDKNDNILRNALLWNDQRTIDEVNYLNEEIGIDNLLEFTGNIALTGLTAPKIMWVKNHEPDIFAKIDKVMLPKDYLIYKLTNVFASDVSDLSGTLYFNPRTKDYSNEMLDIIGIQKSMLPKIYESYQVVGNLSDEIKTILNINNNIKVIAGGGDQAVGAIGTGVVGNGECSISLGTSGVIFVSSENFNVDKISHFQSYSHANGKYHMMAVMLNAAGSIKWWNESILNTVNYNEYYDKVSKANIEEQLFFLPYLTGERAPINDPYAKGVLFGLGVHHKVEDIDLAVVEGVTFALRDSFELIKKLGVDIKRVRITGGGAKSRVWAQMISDILNVEVSKIKSEEGPALGAAILAMVGCKVFNSVEDACKEIVELDQLFVPDPLKSKYYDVKYSTFIKIYPKLKELYEEMN